MEVGLKADDLEDDRGHGFFGSSIYKHSTRVARWAQPITYLHIYECNSFSVSFNRSVMFVSDLKLFLYLRLQFHLLKIYILDHDEEIEILAINI